MACHRASTASGRYVRLRRLPTRGRKRVLLAVLGVLAIAVLIYVADAAHPVTLGYQTLYFSG